MENSIYIGLSRQIALSNNMDIIANNIANVNTPGFRGQNLLFTQYISNPNGTDAPISMVYDSGQYRNTEAGAVQYTGNPLNVAVAGPGFIGVNGPGGKQAYTRAGEFLISANGTLMTAGGFPVSSPGGSAINIPKNSTSISIDEKGIVSNQSGQVGQIKVVEFANPQDLKPIGNNMSATDDPTSPPTNSRIQDGALESSNVKPITEMTRMIDTLRSFESVQNILQTQHDLIRTAIQRLTSVS